MTSKSRITAVKDFPSALAFAAAFAFNSGGNRTGVIGYFG